MTDIDRYLTEEVVEKAAAAEWASEWPARAFSREPDDLRDTYKRSAQTALSAVLPDIIQQAKVEALREAAKRYQWGGWARSPQARGDMGAKSLQAEHAVKWLRDRADEIAGDDS